MKYIALAKTVLVTIWLRQVVAREDGIRGMNGSTNQEEKVRRLKESRECIRYNSKVWFQGMTSKNTWLTGGRDNGNNGVYAKNYLDGGYEQRDPAKYRWTVRSESGRGDRDYPDPKSGECVAYNDKIFLQVNTINNRWLTGGRGFGNYVVETRDYLLHEQLKVDSPYQWIVRSESGDGRREYPDPLAGIPVMYTHRIFLQVNSRNSRWLKESSDRTVGTNDYINGHYGQRYPAKYIWIVLKESGDGSLPWTSQV